MRVSLRIRRRKWRSVDRINDFRECPECAGLVQGWPGQWRHKEWHEDGTGDELEDPGGIIYGGAMAPADVPVYHDDNPSTEEASYWDG